MSKAVLACTVAIVGGGVAGLALATELKRRGLDDIVVLEREKTAGGAPRHCGHYPFGVLELKRLLKGPDYARALVLKAKEAGVRILTRTTVTALHENARLDLLTPEGIASLQAERVVLCTGVRESSRAQRLLGGQRPLGVMSTGALQSMVYLYGQRPFQRPVILGTELVSMSAIMTCRHLGMRPRAMIEENKRVTVRQFLRPFPAIMGVPVMFGVTNLRILGETTVEAIEYSDGKGVPRRIETDGVIVSGRFRPESALLSTSHLEIDRATGGPSVDQYGRASDPGYFCTGNILRPVETSSWCWHEAVACAARIERDLAEPLVEASSTPLVSADSAIRFVVPQRLVSAHQPGAMEHMQIRLSQPARGRLSITSNGQPLFEKSLNSRPERRILAPLAPILKAGLSAPVKLQILRNS